MIIISAFRDRDEALISKALLEAAGIPVTLKDDGGELQLQVRETDAQLAQDVLAPTEYGERLPSRLSLYRYRMMRKSGVPGHFFKGGSLVVVAFLLLLLFLMPFGLTFRVTPFALVFLFIFGGCVSLLRNSFRIQRKRLPMRRRSL